MCFLKIFRINDSKSLTHFNTANIQTTRHIQLYPTNNYYKIIIIRFCFIILQFPLSASIQYRNCYVTSITHMLMICQMWPVQSFAKCTISTDYIASELDPSCTQLMLCSCALNTTSESMRRRTSHRKMKKINHNAQFGGCGNV